MTFPYPSTLTLRTSQSSPPNFEIPCLIPPFLEALGRCPDLFRSCLLCFLDMVWRCVFIMFGELLHLFDEVTDPPVLGEGEAVGFVDFWHVVKEESPPTSYQWFLKHTFPI
jgi:hypothetical protein